jgi:membrane protease YdiL (CAAX protease family)
VSDAAQARPIGFWQLVVPLIGTIIGLALLVFTAGVVLGFVMEREVTQTEVTEYLSRPGVSYIFLQVMLAAIYIVGTIVLRWTLGRVGRTQMIADYTPAGRGWIVFGALVGVGLVIAVGVISGALEAGGMEFETGPAERMLIPTSPGQILMTIATVVIIGPYFEELYFRGALTSWLAGKLGIVAAILIGSILFGLAHGHLATHPGAQGWVMTGLLAMVGMTAAIIAWRSGSLWPAFATHAAFNATMIGLAMIALDASAV